MSLPAALDARREPMNRERPGAVATQATASMREDPGENCRTCGACCAFSREWPRFTLEADADIDRIPAAFVNETSSGMRCNGDRCSALVGDVGISTSCAVYGQRPEVCRACEPGDDACRIARRHFGIDAGGDR
jgi:Fe-S-cluster containining protein